nr:hypothetical protein BaRGS_003128 [Batillaria attramentaria]
MTIFVLPLNSALNPFLYKLSVMREKKRQCPEGCRCQGLAFVCTKSFPVHNYTQLRYLDASGSGMTPDDLSHNVYLVHLSLSSSDQVYRGDYLWQDKKWKTSPCL